MSIPLRVHCWGGFGSQLNALAVAIEIQRLYPKRKLILVFHTGGVTRRALEISEFLDGIFEFQIIEDFYSSSNVGLSQGKKNENKLRNTSAKKLESLAIILRPLNSTDLLKIKPWTLDIRSHYSYFCFNRITLTEIMEIFKLTDPHLSFNPSIALHYRLGDLLELDKPDIAPERISSILRRFVGIKYVNIFSESTNEARHRLNRSIKGKISNFYGPELPAHQVLGACLSSKIFVGTNSKISIWAALLRNLTGKGNTYLPIQLKGGIERNLYSSSQNLITFY